MGGLLGIYVFLLVFVLGYFSVKVEVDWLMIVVGLSCLIEIY